MKYIPSKIQGGMTIRYSHHHLPKLSVGNTEMRVYLIRAEKKRIRAEKKCSALKKSVSAPKKSVSAPKKSVSALKKSAPRWKEAYPHQKKAYPRQKKAFRAEKKRIRAEKKSSPFTFLGWRHTINQNVYCGLIRANIPYQPFTVSMKGIYLSILLKLLRPPRSLNLRKLTRILLKSSA